MLYDYPSDKPYLKMLKPNQEFANYTTDIDSLISLNKRLKSFLNSSEVQRAFYKYYNPKNINSTTEYFNEVYSKLVNCYIETTINHARDIYSSGFGAALINIEYFEREMSKNEKAILPLVTAIKEASVLNFDKLFTISKLKDDNAAFISMRTIESAGKDIVTAFPELKTSINAKIKSADISK